MRVASRPVTASHLESARGPRVERRAKSSSLLLCRERNGSVDSHHQRAALISIVHRIQVSVSILGAFSLGGGRITRDSHGGRGGVRVESGDPTSSPVRYLDRRASRGDRVPSVPVRRSALGAVGSREKPTTPIAVPTRTRSTRAFQPRAGDEQDPRRRRRPVPHVRGPPADVPRGAAMQKLRRGARARGVEPGVVESRHARRGVRGARVERANEILARDLARQRNVRADGRKSGARVGPGAGRARRRQHPALRRHPPPTPSTLFRCAKEFTQS